MGLLPNRVRVKDVETRELKSSYRNLAQVQSHEDASNLNFLYQYRIDANGPNVYPQKRHGATILSSRNAASTQTGAGITSWRKATATSDSLFYALDDTSNVKLYLDSGGTGTVQQIAAADINLTTGKTVQFVPVSGFDGSTSVDSLYVLTGFDDARIYDGASWSVSAAGTPLSGASNRAMHGVMYRNMLVLARTQNSPNGLWFSDVGKPNTFSTARLQMPGEITGLTLYENFVVVFTNNGIFMLSGANPTDINVSSAQYGLVNKGTRIGCDAPRSIQRVGTWLYFWNRDRCYRFNTAEIQEVAFPKLRKHIDSLVITSSNIYAGASFQNRYYLGVVYSSGTTNNRVLIYDERFDEWVMHSGHTPAAFTMYRSSQYDSPNLVYVTNVSESRTAKVFTYNGSTSPYDRLATTTLNGAITDSATTITLTSAAQFPSSGTIIIDSEVITYTGKSSNDLTGCTRGANNTTAASHSNGATVTLIQLVTFQYTTEHLNFGDSHFIKKPRHIFYNTKSIGATAQITLQAAVDYGSYNDLIDFNMTSGGFILGTSLLGTGKLGNPTISDRAANRLRLPSGRVVSIRAVDTQNIGQTEFYDFDLQLLPKKLKLT